MADLSPDETDQLQMIREITQSLQDWDRQENTRVRELNENEDKFMLWIVGLSAGAIAGVAAAPRLADISRLEAAVIFVCFGLSILFGVISRWMMHQLEIAIRTTSATWQASLVEFALHLTTIKTAKALADARVRLAEIEERKDPRYKSLRANSERWVGRANNVQYVPPGMFILGVLALIIVALINWPGASPQ